MVVAFDMITDVFLAQSFLTFILRVGVWIIISLIFAYVLAYGFVERADRKRRHLGFGIERWVGSDWSFFPFSSVCSSRLFFYLYTRRLVDLLAIEGVSVWEGRVVCPFVIWK